MSKFITIKFGLVSGSISVQSQLTLSNGEWIQVHNACKKHLTCTIGTGINRVDILYDAGVCSAWIVNAETKCFIEEEADKTLERMCAEALYN